MFAGAYPEILRGERGSFGILFSKNPTKLNNFSLNVGVQTPWIRPLHARCCYSCWWWWKKLNYHWEYEQLCWQILHLMANTYTIHYPLISRVELEDMKLLCRSFLWLRICRLDCYRNSLPIMCYVYYDDYVYFIQCTQYWTFGWILSGLCSRVNWGSKFKIMAKMLLNSIKFPWNLTKFIPRKATRIQWGMWKMH